MKPKFTIEQAKQYVTDNFDGIMQAYRDCKEIPDCIRGQRLEVCWQAGCWLTSTLRDLGATEQEVYDIGFAHGQRSAFGDAWKWAVAYANEFAESKTVADKPGIELADRINAEHLRIL